jgi:tungstate transport system substrate-binding protein
MVLNFGPKRSTAPLATLVVAIVLIAALVVYDRSSDTKGELVLATTTSTYDSGLLDHIIPEFERTFDVSVKVVATGTGQALRLGRTGDADVVMVHSPLAEMEFVKEGYGPYRVGVMHNEFVLVGPADDPAGIRALPTVAQALEAIFETGSTFCSRGDDSGTHMKERSLWDLTAVQYETIASRKNSDWYHTLTDDGTFYALMDDLELVILNSGDTALVNPYSVIPVNGTRHPNVEEDLAQKFADWIVSDDIQVMIDSYSRDGRTLFSADAVEI